MSLEKGISLRKFNNSIFSSTAKKLFYREFAPWSWEFHRFRFFNKWTGQISSLTIWTFFCCRHLKNSSNCFSCLSYDLMGNNCAPLLLLAIFGLQKKSFWYYRIIIIENINCHDAIFDMVIILSALQKKVTFETTNWHAIIGFSESCDEIQILRMKLWVVI